MYVPNAFATNGDGGNDKFYPKLRLGLGLLNYESIRSDAVYEE